MWHVLALSPVSLSVLPSSGTTVTVSMGRMQGPFAAVSVGLCGGVRESRRVRGVVEICGESGTCEVGMEEVWEWVESMSK